jgi:hypothetical protein
MSDGPAPIEEVLGDVLGVELLSIVVEDGAVVLAEGEVVEVLLSCAITGRAQARPRVAAAATWESFFMEITPWVSMNP